MKVYGNLDMQGNIISGLTLQAEVGFPTSAGEGRLAFVNNVLYISVTINSQVSWIPLTNELQTMVYTTSFASTTWEIQHNYGTYEIIVQVYDGTDHVVVPDSIQQTDENTMVITFGEPTEGKAVLFSKKTVG
jgi:hypothetical protein